MSRRLAVRPAGPTLSAVLAKLGYEHRSAGFGNRSIARGGVEVFSGPWYAAWAWLIHTRQITFHGEPGPSIRAAMDEARSR